MLQISFQSGGSIFCRRCGITGRCWNACLPLQFLNCLLLFEWTLFTNSCFGLGFLLQMLLKALPGGLNMQKDWCFPSAWQFKLFSFFSLTPKSYFSSCSGTHLLGKLNKRQCIASCVGHSLEFWFLLTFFFLRAHKESPVSCSFSHLLQANGAVFFNWPNLHFRILPWLQTAPRVFRNLKPFKFPAEWTDGYFMYICLCAGLAWELK